MPEAVTVELIAQVGAIATAAVVAFFGAKRGLSAAIAGAMGTLLKEYREMHRLDQEKMEELKSEVASLRHRVVVLTAHVETLERHIRRHGVEPPPRPQIEENLPN